MARKESKKSYLELVIWDFLFIEIRPKEHNWTTRERNINGKSYLNGRIKLAWPTKKRK